MPKSKNSRQLFEKCWGCDGTRKLTKPAHLDITRTKSRNAQVGEDCPLCTDGYFEVGVTADQLERIVEKNEAYLKALSEVAAELKKRAPSFVAMIATIDALKLGE